MARPFLSVVVVCHPGQYKYLPEAIASVEKQTRAFDLKILVFDLASQSEAPSIQLPRGWQMISGAWDNVNEARNAGMRRAMIHSDWITFWDATHRCGFDYCLKFEQSLKNVDANVGVVYPNVALSTASGMVLNSPVLPEWSALNNQEHVLCSSASFWHKLAINALGGFNPKQVGYENYELALRLSRCGWSGKLLDYKIHSIYDGHSPTINPLEALWNAWSYGFVTLWSGNKRTEYALLDWYANADIPPNSTLYCVDNSGGRLKGLLTSEYNSHLHKKFSHLVYMDAGEPFKIDPKDTYFNFQRHTHVAHLYNRILPRVNEEIVVTVEDDMVPPLDGVRSLVDLIRPNTKVAMATGVYRARTNPEHICAATGKGRWMGVHNYDNLPNTPFEIGMSGGGFAIFANWALRRAMPMRCVKYPDGYMLGWDGNLGNALTALGYKLLADPSVKCEHLCPEVLEYLKGCKGHPTAHSDPYSGYCSK